MTLGTYLGGSCGAMCQMEGKSKKLQEVAMCHHLRGWKSKVLDEWIREI